MKDVKKCSLSGIAFTIDVDAFETLGNYIDSLRRSYGETADGEEIVADIEARIAELILSAQGADMVVEKPLVDDIILQMGSPEDISGDGEGADETAGQTAGAAGEQPAAGRTGEPRIPRRLYRDMENARLGGVCAGMAKYFDIDPVIVRLLITLPLWMLPISGFTRIAGPLLGNMLGMFVLAYIVMWFAVPPARSARQKLEMNGERITARSIRDTTVAEASNDADSQAKPVVANVVTVFGQIVLILLKILAGIIVFGLIMAACAMIIGIFFFAIRGTGLFNAGESALLSVTAIMVALVLVVMLIYVLMCLIASRKPNARTVLVMFIIWLMTVVACVTTAIRDVSSHDSIMQMSVSRESEIEGDTIYAVTTIEPEIQDVDIRYNPESGQYTVGPSNGN